MNEDEKTKKLRINIWLRIAAIIAIILVFGAGYLFFAKLRETRHLQSLGQHIKPGSHKAWLTLASGKRINLTDASNGLIANQSGIVITKASDGELVYTVAKDQPGKPIAEHNVIEIPKGGQFQIRLSDGTAVWLNASSSLEYATFFASPGDRKVHLSGEAYFEVARDKERPFMIRTRAQEIKVLGTHFNVNSYEDADSIKTTLLEGDIIVAPLGYENGHENMARYGSGVRLKPGQQSSNRGGYINVKKVEPKQVVAWKEGYFNFDNKELKDIMKEISRWYDVDVNYQDEISVKGFAGSISRFKNLSELLQILESTRLVHFKIQDRTITVMK